VTRGSKDIKTYLSRLLEFELQEVVTWAAFDFERRKKGSIHRFLMDERIKRKV
jgi:hypothetical protein